MSFTEKPTKLLTELILDSTNIGDTVADFCGGSFSTGVAAISLGRKFIGVEINKEQFNKSSKRIDDMFGESEWDI